MKISRFLTNGMKRKKSLEEIKPPQFSEREVLYIKMGKNVGFEQDGKGEDFLRPVLAYKKFNKEQFLGFALTSQKKSGKYYVEVHHNKRTSYVILSQVRTYSSKRISHSIGKISKAKMMDIHKKFINLATPSK